MKATAGASRDRLSERGYASLGMVVVLFGLVIVGVMLAPNLVLQVNARKRIAEEQTLTRIGQGLSTYIQKSQVVPGTSSWSTAISSVTGLSQTEVEQVLPGFASDTNTRRVFLIDPGLGGASPPYTQSVAGLAGTWTNLMGQYSRLMLVSCTKRSLSLPVSTGVPSSNNFYGLWNWTYNPVTEAPPSGWSSAWTGQGEFLHVQRINLANLFHTLAFSTLKYGFESTNAMTNTVGSSTSYRFLRGTPP